MDGVGVDEGDGASFGVVEGVSLGVGVGVCEGDELGVGVGATLPKL